MCLGQKGQSDSLGSFHKNFDPSHKGAEGVGLFPKGLPGGHKGSVCSSERGQYVYS